MITRRDERGRIIVGSGGRPKGSRNKLQKDFIGALAADFEEHGEGVVRVVRAERPDVYLKVIASILPKELLVTDSALEEMTDDEIIDALAVIERLRAGKDASGARKKASTATNPSESRH
jgi:hypothetical protein